MTEKTKLHYIKHQDIDYDKWDRCIDAAINSRIYANTWHLDRTATYWDALVMGDYEYVMPLPIRRKFGITYLFQPMFSQQLGIYPAANSTISSQFYDYLVRHFRYAKVHLNAGNLPWKNSTSVDFQAKQNYLLPLEQSYTGIKKFFSSNAKRNIAKANTNNLSLIQGIRLETYLDFIEKNLQASISKSSIATLKNLIAYGQYKGFGEIYGVYTSDNELCSAVYFCRWKDRVIYFSAASNEAGKEMGGMYFLVNEFIKQNVGKNLTLDFEGSMLPGVARFFDSFGASPETYFQLHFNRLPLPLKWLKA
ncbi:hypothetical protein [Maribellus sediminis]|uniref:hypothetical protein n=1 Tax=Maribellus sediminis TaxID=2696285 RepID=UPI0014307510|nr:hypothetical protein [Maribellus sediminis]